MTQAQMIDTRDRAIRLFDHAYRANRLGMFRAFERYELAADRAWYAGPVEDAEFGSVTLPSEWDGELSLAEV